jgi:hypothetical protein
VIEVTGAGRKRVAAANQIVKRVQADVLASLGDDGDALMSVLADLVQNRLSEHVECKSVRRREPRPRTT